MRSHHRRALLALTIPTMFLLACGDGDDDPSAADPASGDDGVTAGEAPDPGEESSDDGDGGPDGLDLSTWPPEELPGTGGAGTVTIDGASYEMDVVVECDLTDFFAGDRREREWEIQGAALENPDEPWGDVLVVKAWTGTMSNPESDEQGIGWDGPEGLYEGSASGNGVWQEASNALDGPPLQIGDERVTGELRLRSALGSEPVAATIDLSLPDVDGVVCY